MGMEERIQRHKVDLEYVHTATALSWADKNMSELRVLNMRRRMSRISLETDAKLQGLQIQIPPRIDTKKVLARYWRSKKRLLFLDYDGTLVPIARTPKEAVPNRRVLDMLKVLAAVCIGLLSDRLWCG